MYINNPEKIFTSTLYIIPTPIGNVQDITLRAIAVLKGVNLIAAEDTRRTAVLLKHFSINTLMFTFHNYNERQKAKILLEKLKQGQSIALVADAGSPLINDPGYHLVRICREANIRIVPLPGACAGITALSASGLPSDRFCYEGFLPAKRTVRLKYLQSLEYEPRTLIFYESTHRLLESLQDMIIIWGPERYVVLARELTKTWESIYGAPVGALLTWVHKEEIRRRGEITMIVKGFHKHKKENMLSIEVQQTMKYLIAELPIKKAANIVSKIYRVKKTKLYRYALELKQQITDDKY